MVCYCYCCIAGGVPLLLLCWCGIASDAPLLSFVLRCSATPSVCSPIDVYAGLTNVPGAEEAEAADVTVVNLAFETDDRKQLTLDFRARCAGMSL